MSRRPKNDVMAGRFFRWILKRRHRIWYADGRGNTPSAGRHSLGTTDRETALQQLRELDLAIAVTFGKADRSELNDIPHAALDLQAGADAYLEHLSRPVVAGGAKAKTRQRYRAAFDKFFEYARRHRIHVWQRVDKTLITAYLTELERRGYADRTIYLEGTLFKQFIRWAISDGRLPPDRSILLPLRKPSGTTTYCWRVAEVNAMLEHCLDEPGLNWLFVVLLVLSRTGLRIGEASSLRWSDIDLDRNIVQITNDRVAAGARRRDPRVTKNREDRFFPIARDLLPVLKQLRRSADGRVLHGPRRGLLKADTVRNILVKKVITPLEGRFPMAPGERGFKEGRLHSFRHFFCSRCANEGVPERMVSNWLGHKDSGMIRVYYHMYDEDAQRQMRNVSFAGGVNGGGAVDVPPEDSEALVVGPTIREAS